MIFSYSVIDQQGKSSRGEIDAGTRDLAINALQSRGFIVVSVETKGEAKGMLNKEIPLFDKVPLKDLVMMSRQIATLFEAQVSAVNAFNLLAENVQNEKLSNTLTEVSRDLQGGIAIDVSMKKHPKVFSNFYIGMVKAGSESGRLRESFSFLADYLERQYELTTKMRNALIYPSFILAAFVGVMVLMLTFIIPKIGQIIVESGQEIPPYTKFVLFLSDALVNYGWLMFIIFVGVIAYVIYVTRQTAGKIKLDHIKLTAPYFGKLFRKVYLTRIADNLHTTLAAGIPVVRSIEITADVVGNSVYEDILHNALNQVKSGVPISKALTGYDEVPKIMTQMISIGEETGSMGTILETLTRFYKREVDSAVDNLISLIEPAMIIMLSVGVGFLLVSVLLPMYNLTSGI